MVETSDRLRERLATLRSVSRALARPLDISEVLRAVHLELSRVLDVTICFCGLYDPAGQSVEVIWQMHEGEELPGGAFPLGAGPTSRAIREREPQLIREWSKQGPGVQVQYATRRTGLPESSIAAPVVFDGEVIGVLVVQSYHPRVYDEDDVALIQGVADQVALKLAEATGKLRNGHSKEGVARGSDVEALIASMPDALLVLDTNGRLVRLNQAARKLLSGVGGTFILGYPVDRPQNDHWPLGTRAITEHLQPIVDQLKRGTAPEGEIRFENLSCRASVVFKEGQPAGGMLVLRELQPSSRAA